MSLTLFDAAPPQARPPLRRSRRGARAAQEPLPQSVEREPGPLAQYDLLPESMPRPELESAAYWFEQMRAAPSAERKAECHHNMVRSLTALKPRGGAQ